MRSLAEAATFQAVRPAPNPFPRHRDPVDSGPPGERPVKAQNVQAAGVPVLANTSASEQASAEQERSHGVQRNRSEDGGGTVVDRKGRDALLAAVPSLRAFAMSLTGNVDRADDLVQDTIVRAWSHFDHFKPGTNLHASLFTILRNLFHSDYRKRKRKRKRKREVEDPNASLAQRVAV